MVNPSAPDILKRIIAVKVEEIQQQAAMCNLAKLKIQIQKSKPPLNLAGSLWGSEVKIIAEVKKASPVKGVFRKNFDHVELKLDYSFCIKYNTTHYNYCILIKWLNF